METTDPPVQPPGVDETLIEAFLALSPTERLRRNEEMSRTVRALQAAFLEAERARAARSG